MRYATLCSGIGAPEHAFRDFGWTCVFASEIDRFAKCVYAHHYPSTPIYGDFRDLTPEQTGPIDFVVAGTPCQDFSIAGLRKGLAGDRGALTIEFVRFLERYGCPQFLWENVPGVLSSDKGRAFGIFLGALEKLGYHLAWRTLDAQYFGAPQRRRRVFVVGDIRDQRAIAILFEPGGMSWDTSQGSEAREDVTGTLSARSSAGGGLGTDFELGGGYSWTPRLANALSAQPQLRQDVTMDNIIAFANTAGDTNLGIDEERGTTPPITTRNGDPGIVAFTTQQEPKAIDDETSFTVTADSPSGGGQRQCVAYQCQGSNVGEMGTLRAGNGNVSGGVPFVALALRGEGHDASDDGTRQTLIVAPAVSGTLAASGGGSDRPAGQGNETDMLVVVYDGAQVTSKEHGSNPQSCDPSHPIDRANAGDILLAFTSKDYGADAGETSPTLRALEHDASHANGGGQVAIASPFRVRRLMPVECERLQSFPDNYTLVPIRTTKKGKVIMASDGPRYRALGNSMNCDVIHAIGERIRLVSELMAERESGAA